VIHFLVKRNQATTFAWLGNGEAIRLGGPTRTWAQYRPGPWCGGWLLLVSDLKTYILPLQPGGYVSAGVFLLIFAQNAICQNQDFQD
jgi:hypothetical protein